MGRMLIRALQLTLVCACSMLAVVHGVDRAFDAPIDGVRVPATSRTSLSLADGLVGSNAGCLRDRTAAGLNDFFSQRIGPVLGFDSPRVLSLGGDRYLWLLQDAFVDYTGNATTLAAAKYVNSSVLVQEGDCFTLVQRGTTTEPESFEPGNGSSFEDYYWPGGASVAGDHIEVFWIHMHRDEPTLLATDGISVHPVDVWLATYDSTSLARTSFEPAVEPGVHPIYGWNVVDADGYSYLYGNTFQQNLAREGGYIAGPHSATAMWLARVPRGDLAAAPEYRTETGWSSSATEATPISSRFWIENMMQTTRIGEQWLSATKVDGFWGSNMLVETGDDPAGPWSLTADVTVRATGRPDDMVTYAPIVLPWLGLDHHPLVMLSQIDTLWEEHEGGDPARYRPQVIDIHAALARTGARSVD
ncbi:MAG: hypothetical protein JWM34_1508 [Ilumatobacteraceae bacterium]|nr:hypothetical protein [Ilumatobacteraceae bacterium]